MLQLGELGARRVLEGGVLLRLGVELDIERDQLVDLACLHRLTAAPLAVGDDQLAELRAPVAEVVDADAVPARKGVQLLQRMPDDRRAEMPDVERLCDVRGGVVKHDRLARAVLA